ncbi:MAG: thioredoxin domain-containing protein [Bacteroidota bacterium]|nr:thioredoxin domain-containing protein [Bacteroidota bacterium]
MKAPIIVLLSILFLAGCSSTKKLAVKPNEHLEVGWTPRSIFQAPPYAAWFDTMYNSYIPEETAVERLKNMKDNVELVVVYATWCSDTKREMPRFFKIMDQIEFPPYRITLIAVDRTMMIPEGIKKEYEITNVPTFMVKYKGMEMGRIIESPRITIEQDLVDWLSPLFP